MPDQRSIKGRAKPIKDQSKIERRSSEADQRSRKGRAKPRPATVMASEAEPRATSHYKPHQNFINPQFFIIFNPQNPPTPSH